MWVIKVNGLYIMKVSNYRPMVLTDDLQKALTFRTKGGAKNSRCRPYKEHPDWVTYRERMFSKRSCNRRSAERPSRDTPYYTDELKAGVEIIEVNLYRV